MIVRYTFGQSSQEIPADKEIVEIASEGRFQIILKSMGLCYITWEIDADGGTEKRPKE